MHKKCQYSNYFKKEQQKDVKSLLLAMYFNDGPSRKMSFMTAFKARQKSTLGYKEAMILEYK